MTDTTRYASSGSGRSGISLNARKPALITRIRFQLLGGLLVALVAPLLLRFGVDPVESLERNVNNTLAGIAVAVILGYFALRRMSVTPGVRAVGYVAPVFALSFLLVIAAFFFLRLDYGRAQFALGLLLCVIWFTAVLSAAAKAAPQRMALVPIGGTLDLRGLTGIDWTVLPSPDMPVKAFDGVVADLRADHPPAWQRFIADCVLAGTPVFHVKQVRESLTGRVEIEHLSENTLGSLNPNGAYLRIKRLIDSSVAAVFLLVASPLLALIALAVRLESPGPALFTQKRVGYGGELFTIYKFRTMVDAAQARDAREAAITRDGDKRVTRLGRFLRRTRIDELPQAINILKGEMSWIGPRPEAAPLSKWYEAELPFYRYRHIVRPGISGWAQVNQGHVADVDQVLEKLHYDFYYIKNFSPWLDVVIVLKTIRTMLTGFGAR